MSGPGVSSKLADAMQYKHDVFIVYKTGADDDLAHKICDTLERNSFNVVAQWKQEAFPAGVPTFESIVNCVHNSSKTLLILTKKALESPWIILEAVQAMEQSKRCNVLTLRLLLHGVKEKECTFLKRGILASVPHFRLDFNKDNWPAVLIENIEKVVPLPNILPIEGSLAHGLVFSHYSGFLSYVLPVLKETIGNSDIYRKMPQHVSRKYYILIPGTCNIYDNLESYDEENEIRIEKGDSMEFKRMHAGKERTFALSIYKISKCTPAGIESYYFFADFPNVLKAIYTMSKESLAEVDMRLQLARFYYVLGDVINHAENESCFDTVKIILYNENVETMQAALFNAVQRSIGAEVIKDLSADMFNTSINERTPQDFLSEKEENIKCDATVSCLLDETEDCEVALEITSYLESKKMTVYLDKGNDKAFYQHPAKWHIFVLSKNAIKEPNALLLKCFSTLHEGLCSNTLQVLPVIVGIMPEDIPRYIKWVTLVSAAEPKYCEKLLMSMKGGVVRMEHRLPSGDVATGLAWAYVINYLRITLLCRSSQESGSLDLIGRIRKFLIDKNIQCGCILKMFPMLPGSCTLEDSLRDKANEGYQGFEVIKYLGRLDPVYQNTGGQLGRPFYLHVYMYTDPATHRSVCFIAEYFTPGHCLHEMAYHYPFAGLQKEDMLIQGSRVVNHVPEILSREAVKQKIGDMSNLVEIIYYDDTQELLLTALHRHIQERSHEMVYAREMQQSGDPNYHLPSVCNR